MNIKFSLIVLLTFVLTAKGQTVLIGNPGLTMSLNCDNKASITSLVVNGRKVIGSETGIYTSINVSGHTYSSLHLKSAPMLVKTPDKITLSGIKYGDDSLTVDETWVFTTKNLDIVWSIQRSLSKPTVVEESATPVFTFDKMDTWEGAYQGYGGVAWFYLFNEALCTYGVHTQTSSFWNSKNNNGLNIAVAAPGKKVAMKYSRTADDKLSYTITVSDQEMLPKFDSGTNRRRFIRKRTDVWAPYTVAKNTTQTITFSAFEFNQQYGRGKFVGINGSQVSAVLNTIARIGVIDSLHFGGNSWHTPYGPICLHEQYIGQLGLAIDDPSYLKGYQSCLDFYRDHAIKPDGRVFPRWAYTDEDMMPGQGNKAGFYEAQWGWLLDSNPDLVSNVSDLYDLTGDKDWVRGHQRSCETALDWIIRRDSDGNGLVEMIPDNEREKRSSDWIDIIWASYENAFVNAKLYHALVEWTAIERQLGNQPKANTYQQFAAKLKASFNKPTSEGGFWDEANSCYVHWIDRDKTIHGRNMVTPVNFMAIAYGICDDDGRRKRILDKIEAQMVQERLFFWPICMTTYAPGEGNDWQFPFPNYENGDLFLSWGSIAVKAYAAYKPELAVKYVRNVLDQYSKDGLAFQRYGRGKQNGLGDDILSGNSLAIVGLYQAIYGINPLYNRFYLDPHLTPELAGTELTYRFRGQRLTINLDSNQYSVANSQFKVAAHKDFGFYASKNHLAYFNGNADGASLEVKAEGRLTIDIGNWGTDKMAWKQMASTGGPITYTIHALTPNAPYFLQTGNRPSRKLTTDAHGNLVINTTGPTSLSLKAAAQAVPWTTVEAETMHTTGTVLGPSYEPYRVETESSGQRCVKLAAKGEFVEFRAPVQANSLVIRYSLPDKREGCTLAIYKNGSLVRHVPISSRYSWLYGKYPFTNDPAAGSPRNFYDELRLKDLKMEQGDLIRIQQDDNAGYCIIDLVDLEEIATPLQAPANSLSITDPRFQPDNNDYTLALQKCIAKAVETGKTVWIPIGQFKLTGDIVLPANLSIRGAGMWYTELVGDETLYAQPDRRIRLKGNGSNIHLADLAIIGKLDYRSDKEANDGIVGSWGTGSTIDRIWIEHTKVGMWLENSEGLKITGCRMRNTIADGINFCVGMAQSTIESCAARGTGDDCFAVWPTTYTKQQYKPGHNLITHCTAQLPFLANGAAIYGGESNAIRNCAFQDISAGSAILISTTFPTANGDIDNNFSGTTVVEDCTIKTSGGFDHEWGWRAAVEICVDKRNIAGLRLANLNITNSISNAISVIAKNELGALSDASLANSNISGYGIGTKDKHGLFVSEDAHGSLTIDGKGIADTKNESANFTLQQ